MRASQLLKLINSLPLISYRTVFHTLSYLPNYLTATAVEYGLTANLPARAPAAVESLN